MLEPLKNKSYIFVSLFIFLSPFFPLLYIVYVIGDKGRISILFFSLFVSIEFILSIYFFFLEHRKKITKQRSIELEYALRSIAGLPLTVYYFLTAPFGFTGLLRLLPTIMILSDKRMASIPYWYTCFFFSGLIIVSMLENPGKIGVYPLILAFTGGALGLLIIWQNRSNGIFNQQAKQNSFLK